MSGPRHQLTRKGAAFVKGLVVVAFALVAYAAVTDTEDRRIVIFWKRDLDRLIIDERIKAATEMADAIETKPPRQCDWRDLYRDPLEARSIQPL